jgi:hypothetical protein
MSFAVLLLTASLANANPPVAQYLFPAGGRQGTTVGLKIGGIDLNRRCSFEMLGPGVEASKQIERTKTVWFEGPLLPLPESQQQEDYPQDMSGQVKIAADAPPGVRHARAWTSQGTSPALKFIVGDLPEVIENEIDGEPIAENVTLPVTANGRIFPREDIDLWAFEAKKGQTIWCEVTAARLGSPLDSLLEILDPHGRVIAENDDAFGSDSFVRFTAAEDGKYQARIRDVNFRGGQAFVYRLTISSGPRVDRIYPLGGKRGQTTRFELTGSGLPAGTGEIAIPADAPRDFAHRLAVAGTQTNPFVLETDDLPEILEAEPNDAAENAKPVTVPAVLNGRIDRPGDRDCWAIAMKKGDVLEFDLRAQRFGSPLLAVLTLSNEKGDEVARAESGPDDARFRFTAPADGNFTLCVADRFRNRGGPEFAYRIRIDKPEAPSFRLRLATDAVTVLREAQAPLKLFIDRAGCSDPIDLKFDGLPADVTVANPKIGANQAAIDLQFKAAPTAKIGVSHLTITGTAKMGDRTISATAQLSAERGTAPLNSVLLAVGMPTPFKVIGEHDFRWAPRGTVFQRTYKIERKGYDGPIEVSLADRQARHIQGVTGPTITVPAGAAEFEYGVNLPPWMEMGRTSRVCISSSAVIKDTDGTEHTVSFSSVQQNDQMVAVIGPERVSLELEKSTIVPVPGQAIELPLKIARGKDLKGAVKVEVIVPAHMTGIQAEPITVAGDKNAGTLAIRFPAKLGPMNAPLVIRATATENGKPVIAEAKLEVLADR